MQRSEKATRIIEVLQRAIEREPKSSVRLTFTHFAVKDEVRFFLYVATAPEIGLKVGPDDMAKLQKVELTCSWEENDCRSVVIQLTECFDLEWFACRIEHGVESITLAEFCSV